MALPELAMSGDAGAADEQGLGKTVCCAALIVSRGPTAQEHRMALDHAKRSNTAMELHPLSSQARAVRAAQLGISPAAAPPPRILPSSSAGE